MKRSKRRLGECIRRSIYGDYSLRVDPLAPFGQICLTILCYLNIMADVVYVKAKPPSFRSSIIATRSASSEPVIGFLNK